MLLYTQIKSPAICLQVGQITTSCNIYIIAEDLCWVECTMVRLTTFSEMCNLSGEIEKRTLYKANSIIRLSFHMQFSLSDAGNVKAKVCCSSKNLWFHISMKVSFRYISVPTVLFEVITTCYISRNLEEFQQPENWLIHGSKSLHKITLCYVYIVTIKVTTPLYHSGV